MSNWKKSKIYCNGCKRWKNDIEHRGCNGGVWLDIVNGKMGCDKCKQVWQPEENTFYCTCGHIQKTYYTDSAYLYEATGQVIASEGNMVYVLTQSGAVVVGCRNYHNIAY